jgi:hypothetical protein
MKKVQIGEVAEVRMGVTLRGRDATRPDPQGSCRLIRISDLSDDGQLVNRELLRFEPADRIRAESFLRAGDVLLPNRGTRTTAYAFDLPDQDALVGAQFYVLRPDPKIIRPDYLSWFLRSDVAAAHLSEHRKGTLVQTVQRRDVLEMELPLPPLQKQALIAALDRLGVEEKQLTSRLAGKKAFFLQHQLLKAATSL